MVIDASAIKAILLLEPEAENFAKAIEAARRRRMSAVTALELGRFAESHKGEAGVHELDFFLLRAAIEIMPFDSDQATLARQAFRDHQLGFSESACYALAMIENEPILAKDGIFEETNITVARE